MGGATRNRRLRKGRRPLTVPSPLGGGVHHQRVDSELATKVRCLCCTMEFGGQAVRNMAEKPEGAEAQLIYPLDKRSPADLLAE